MSEQGVGPSEWSEALRSRFGIERPELYSIACGQDFLIDDDCGTRLAYAGILRHEGVVVGQAGDGQDGFQRAVETLPNLINTDISMPIMNGRELMRRLRTDHRTRRIPVIVCSGGQSTGRPA